MKNFVFLLLLMAFRAPAFGACELYDLEITRSDCNEHRQFYVTINFQYHDVSDCFTIKGNGKNYGTFRYSQLPITLGPFEGDCRTIYEFVIRDCHNEHCTVHGALDVVCCEEHCELGELRIEKTHCDSSGKFCAFLNFNHKGNSKCFNVYGNGKHYGRFSYSQLPIKICGLEGDCETEYEFEVKDCEDPECSTSGYLGVVCCEPPCHLYDLRLERTDCDSHGRFFVYLNFHYSGTSRCFFVHGNGKTYGPFNYTQLPVKLGPFDGDCTTVYEFSVVDCENRECKVSKELGKVCCEKPHCEIKNLRIEKTHCDSHNNFFVIIRFQYSGTSHCFKVRGNGRNYGTFQYSQLPITIGPLKGDCHTHYEFVVEDCEHKDCKASKALGIVCCEWKREHGEEESLRKQDQIRASEKMEMQKSHTAKQLDQEVQWRITQDQLELHWDVSDKPDADLRIYHLSGQLLYQYSGTGSGGTLQIPIASWAPGLYFIKFRSGSNSSVWRFFK